MAMTSATDTTRRDPGLCWLLAVLSAAVVFPGVRGVGTFGAAWRLPRRRVAFIVLAVVLIVWTLLFTPWCTSVDHGSSVRHWAAERGRV